VGARIVALGNGALVIDADSGELVRIDGAGRVRSRLEVGRGAGQLAYEPERSLAFVADRRRDRLVVVDVARMRRRAAWRTPAEPFGVAITPDRSTVLVATIADRTLVAYDATSGRQRWRVKLSPEPRSVAISPDGKRALVSSIATGNLDHISVADGRRIGTIEFDSDCSVCRAGQVFTRGTGVVSFLDARRAVAAFQRSVPEADFARGIRYGGGRVIPPVTHHIAFLVFPKRGDPGQAVAQIADHGPRALAWDPSSDTLAVAGLGSDTVLELPRLTSSTTEQLRAAALSTSLESRRRCGPDGIAFTKEHEALIWCSFSRSVLRVSRDSEGDTSFRESSALTATRWTREQQLGRLLFHVNSRQVNRSGHLSCSSCHPEGRADGLSWYINGRRHQTPILAGRLVGTAPYKWDGSDATLSASINTTISRLAGSGLHGKLRDALIAYIRALPPLRKPTRDPAAVGRGARVFRAAGCADCHRGVLYTDNRQHQLESSLNRANTPSLVGLHASAPYYHDGSAATLHDLLRGRGSVKGMANFENLTDRQRGDLEAFLATR
jgi:DNA-binding beta-propeller fold protein YncE/mono/diheme cytochrome c family protein